MVGMRRSARATRTCSRAVPGDMEQAQDSQWARDLAPSHQRTALPASNSPISSSSWHSAWAASPAAAQILPPNTSAVAQSTSLVSDMSTITFRQIHYLQRT